ncbi:hypothetical protein [Saccharococcus caldoxylosilyticus]|nr:hypothetical protein [Parageobacillus caldoxylosilyticus]
MMFKNERDFRFWLDKAYRDGASSQEIANVLRERYRGITEIPDYVEAFLLNQAYGNKLLVIELDSYDSVPTVFYKGKQILGKVKVSFEWETGDGENKKYPHILIKHVAYDKEISNEVPVLKTISIQDLFRNDG